MHFAYPLSLLVLPASALQIPSIFVDFYAPQDSLLLNDTSIPNDQGHDLLKRDGNCPSDYNSCTTLGKNYGGACCTSGSVCTKDNSNNIACCPIGAKCTGSVTQGGTGTAAGGGGGVFGSATTTGTPTTTDPSNPGLTTDPSVTGTASYVANTFFPFPYIPTTYINSAACDSAYSACQTNFAACTANLAGDSFGVTVVAPDGGGVTVAPSAVNVGSASATSICSSLSAQACYNIQSANCAQFGTGTESGGQFIVATGTNGAVRQTLGCMAAAGVMAGLGIAGQMI